MATKSNMLCLQVVHGQKKFDVHLSLQIDQLGDSLCVKHLMSAIFDKTEIPPEAQKLIYKGKSLKDPEEELSKAGLKDGTKVMLIGKKPNVEEDETFRSLLEVETLMDKQEKKLGDITYELDGIHRGYMDKERQSDAVKQLEKRMAAVAENFMKLLERLDSLSFDENNKTGRGKRKTLVNKIQTLLNRVDGLSRGCKYIEQKKEIDARLKSKHT